MKRYILLLVFSLGLFVAANCQTPLPCLWQFDDGRCGERGYLEKGNKYNGPYIQYNNRKCREYNEVMKGNYLHDRKVGLWYCELQLIPKFLVDDYQKMFEQLIKENGLEIGTNGNIELDDVSLPYKGNFRHFYSVGTAFRHYLTIKTCNPWKGGLGFGQKNTNTDDSPDSEDYDNSLLGNHFMGFGYVWYEDNEAIAAWKEPINSYSEALKVKDMMKKLLTDKIFTWKKILESEKQKLVQQEEIKQKIQADKERKEQEILLRKKVIENRANRLLNNKYIDSLNTIFNELIYKNKFQEAFDLYNSYDDSEVLSQYTDITNSGGFILCNYNRAFALWGMGEIEKSYNLFKSLKDKSYGGGSILNYFKDDLKNYKKNGSKFPDVRKFIKGLEIELNKVQRRGSPSVG